MRWVLNWMAVGAFIGGTLATLIAPWVLKTLLATTGASDAMCQCSELVRNTSSTLIQTQLWGAVGGAVIVPLVAHLMRRKFGKRTPPAINASAPTPQP
jgi:hypothetical protein